MTTTHNFGIAIFKDLNTAAIADNNGVRFVESLEEAFDPNTIYLTNIDAEIEFLPITPEQKRQLLGERSLSVRVYAIAQDLGWPVQQSIDNEHTKASILSAIRQGYLSAFHRAGLTVGEIAQLKSYEFLNVLYQRTMPREHRGDAWPDIMLDDRATDVHAWVPTGQEPAQGYRIRTLSVNRSVFYNACLSQPIPTGHWTQGDPSATQSVIMGCMSSTQGVLLKGKLSPPTKRAFIPSCYTMEERDCYIAHELTSIEEEGGRLGIEDWWYGPLTSIKHPLTEHYQASLGDAILLEMVHRSWRRNIGTGYWLACTERLMLHGIAEALNAEGIAIIGYGSGRITIATPIDPEREAIQDKLLSKFTHMLALQIPINSAWAASDITWRAPMFSHLQRLHLCSSTTLAELDRAIDENSQPKIDEILNQAKHSFHELFKS